MLYLKKKQRKAGKPQGYTHKLLLQYFKTIMGSSGIDGSTQWYPKPVLDSLSIGSIG